MENNLVELKYDKVNEYFEKFKKKYKEDYKNNMVKTTHYVGRNYDSLFVGIFAVFVVPVLLLFIRDLAPVPTTESSGWSSIPQLLNSWIIPVVLIVGTALFIGGVMNFMRSGYEEEVTYTEKEYYAKIKPRMLEELRKKLHNAITESILIFDTNGLIIAPNLNTNDGKKIFGEVERKLKGYGK